jgi:hypothetical protein
MGRALSCAFIFFQTIQTMLAADLNKEIPNCAEWLASADAFLDECQAHARYFTRTFYPSGGSRGEKEENSAWFGSGPANSHFLMGCTLRRDRALNFLGLYYTAEPSATAETNTAPILGIGFDGDVVLSVDGHPVKFVAVQPFDTPKVNAISAGRRNALRLLRSTLREARQNSMRSLATITLPEKCFLTCSPKRS